MTVFQATHTQWKIGILFHCSVSLLALKPGR